MKKIKFAKGVLNGAVVQSTLAMCSQPYPVWRSDLTREQRADILEDIEAKLNGMVIVIKDHGGSAEYRVFKKAMWNCKQLWCECSSYSICKDTIALTCKKQYYPIDPDFAHSVITVREFGSVCMRALCKMLPDRALVLPTSNLAPFEMMSY